MPSIQLHVSLMDTKPLIWRRIIVPAYASAYELHMMIQFSMGWRNHHLFEFRYGMFTLGLVDDYGEVSKQAQKEMESTTVETMASSVNSFTYLYDMGDYWMHKVKVEEFLDKDVDRAYCLEGENACPPEDSGGIPGFYHMLDVIKNKFHPDHLSMVDWLKDWDPEWKKNVFDIKVANEDLLEVQKHSKKNSKSSPRAKTRGKKSKSLPRAKTRGKE